MRYNFHMSEKLSGSSAAQRQSKLRIRAAQEFDVRSFTFLVTREEASFLRSAYRVRYGHDMGLAARRAHRKRGASSEGAAKLLHGDQLVLL